MKLMRPSCGSAAFGNVQVRHDLDARDHRQRQMLRRRRHFVKRAVHAVADAEFGFERLEMNVTRAVLHGLEQDQIHELHDGHLVGQGLGGRSRPRRLRSTSRAMSVSAPSSLRISETFSVRPGRKAVQWPSRFRPGRPRRSARPCLTAKSNFIGARRVQRIGQRDLHACRRCMPTGRH